MGATGTAGTNGSQGAKGDPGPIDSTAPVAPDSLYFTAQAGPLSQFDFHWNMPAGGVAISYFILYQSSVDITLFKSRASMEAVAAASRQTEVTIRPNSGIRYFAISAVSYTGKEGPLSNQLTVDTTSRLAIVSDVAVTGIRQLQVVSAGGGTLGSPLDCTPFGSCNLTNTNAPFNGQNVESAFWSPDARQLAYVADLDGTANISDELFVVAADGSSAPVKVSGTITAGGNVGKSGFSTPAWSPDSTKVAFLASKQTSTKWELYVATPANGAVEPMRLNKPLTLGGAQNIRQFEWSPDGKNIAYLGDQDTSGKVELYLATSSGPAENGTKISGTSVGSINGFHWSPDGSRIAFFGAQASSQKELFVYSLATSSFSKVTPTLLGGGIPVTSGFAWSPDGTTLAYGAPNGGGIAELYTVPATGGTASKVSGSAPNSDIQVFSWSRDGSLLAFLADKVTPGHRDVYVVPASGGGVGLRKLTSSTLEDAQSLRWSITGALAYAYATDSDNTSASKIYVVFPEILGSQPTAVNRTPTFTDAQVDPSTIVWSPDGSRVAYRFDDQASLKFDAFIAAAAGGDDLLLVDGGGTDVVAAFAWSPLGATR
jgi:Tol biopolymer transport system component